MYSEFILLSWSLLWPSQTPFFRFNLCLSHLLRTADSSNFFDFPLTKGMCKHSKSSTLEICTENRQKIELSVCFRKIFDKKNCFLPIKIEMIT